MRYSFPLLGQLGARSATSQAPSSPSAAALNVLHFCAVECRRWLRVAVWTPPKTPPSCCRRVHLRFEGFSQVHVNLKACMHCVVHGARVQRKTLKTELHHLLFIKISLAEEGKHLTAYY